MAYIGHYFNYCEASDGRSSCMTVSSYSLYYGWVSEVDALDENVSSCKWMSCCFLIIVYAVGLAYVDVSFFHGFVGKYRKCYSTKLHFQKQD